eukprot:1160494-Pelagomonas_calceolata.AAC.20
MQPCLAARTLLRGHVTLAALLQVVGTKCSSNRAHEITHLLSGVALSLPAGGLPANQAGQASMALVAEQLFIAAGDSVTGEPGGQRCVQDHTFLQTRLGASILCARNRAAAACWLPSFAAFFCAFGPCPAGSVQLVPSNEGERVRGTGVVMPTKDESLLFAQSWPCMYRGAGGAQYMFAQS